MSNEHIDCCCSFPSFVGHETKKKLLQSWNGVRACDQCNAWMHVVNWSEKVFRCSDSCVSCSEEETRSMMMSSNEYEYENTEYWWGEHGKIQGFRGSKVVSRGGGALRRKSKRYRYRGPEAFKLHYLRDESELYTLEGAWGLFTENLFSIETL